MTFDLCTSLLILLAGFGAGAINSVVGSGTLITFPALVAFGVPPQAATMSNALGLIPGNVAGSFGYRAEMRGHGKRLLKWVPLSVAGSAVGALLLITLPEKTFELVVPVLIILALVMVVVQPRLQAYLKKRKAGLAEKDGVAALAPASSTALSGAAAGFSRPAAGLAITLGVYASLFLTAIYGGYFAAAQGIILIGFLGLLLDEPLQRINAFKNVLVLFVNLVSATVYTIVGFNKIEWMAVLMIALGSLVGGYVGARVGRKLNPTVLRLVIVALGIVAFVRIIQIHA